MRSGLATVEVKDRPKGTQAYTLEYGGSALVQSASRTAQVATR